MPTLDHSNNPGTVSSGLPGESGGSCFSPRATISSSPAAQQAEALRRRLLDRTMVATGMDWLERRVQLGRDVFVRGRPQDERGAGRGGDVVELLRACLAV